MQHIQQAQQQSGGGGCGYSCQQQQVDSRVAVGGRPSSLLVKTLQYQAADLRVGGSAVAQVGTSSSLAARTLQLEAGSCTLVPAGVHAGFMGILVHFTAAQGSGSKSSMQCLLY